ncbi:MAG TPA: M1 family aminopeptidase [Kofleriaceae bacterium]
MTLLPIAPPRTFDVARRHVYKSAMKYFWLSCLAGLSVLGCSDDSELRSAASAGGSDSGSGAVSDVGGIGDTGIIRGPITGDITHYNYTFDLATRHATAGIDVQVAFPGGDCFSTGLELPALSGTTWNGAPARTVSVMNNAVQICGNGVAAGTPLGITGGVTVPSATFLGLDVGFSTKRDLSGGNFTYLMSWIGGCDHFGPCDTAPSKLASYQFTVTHGASDVVLCPGDRTTGSGMTQCSLGAGTSALAPIYSSFAIASDPLWVRNDFVTAAGVNVVFYEVPAGRIARFLDPTSVSAFLTWITGLLGPYPYGTQLRVAGAPTKWLGFEHPGNIIVDQRLPFSGPYQDSGMHVFMHETIHQWAGDRTTIASVLDFGWKEATAEYLSYVFEDEQRPVGEAATSLLYWSAVSLDRQHFLRPTDSPAPAIQDFYGDVYTTGAMMYVQLETLLGRQKVIDGIKSLLVAPGAKSFDDLRHVLEVSSGANLAPYFSAWVFGSGKPEWPTFAIATSQTGNQVTVTLTQQNASHKLYGCKVEIQVRGATSSAVALVDFGVAPTSATASATVTLAEPVVDAVFEPRHRVIGRVAGAPVVMAPVGQVWPL